LPQLVWTCTPDGSCDYLSRQWIEYTGLPEAQQLGFGWLEQIHPGDRDRTVATWQGAVERGTNFDVEFRIRRADGAYRWFKTRAVRVRDAEGRIVKWFGSNTDVEDLKRSEGELSIRNRIAEVMLATPDEEMYAGVSRHRPRGDGEPLRRLRIHRRGRGARRPDDDEDDLGQVRGSREGDRLSAGDLG